jgi:hypothetical protein
MIPFARRCAVLISPLFLLAACGPSGQQRTISNLNGRLLYLMGPDLAAGRAVLQPTSDGARVTLLGTSQFPADEKALDNGQLDVRTSVVEGLLDPRLMQIQLADTSSLPDDQRNARLQNVARYFGAFDLATTTQPAMPPAPAGSVPPGLAITISVVCPRQTGGTGYGDGLSHPVCD